MRSNLGCSNVSHYFSQEYPDTDHQQWSVFCNTIMWSLHLFSFNYFGYFLHKELRSMVGQMTQSLFQKVRQNFLIKFLLKIDLNEALYCITLNPLTPTEEWPGQNFSSQYLYIIKQTSNGNKDKNMDLRILNFSNTKFSKPTS